jgi:hypothetical protein
MRVSIGAVDMLAVDRASRNMRRTATSSAFWNNEGTQLAGNVHAFRIGALDFVKAIPLI